MADKSSTLQEHQSQCDARYVMWQWLVGILLSALVASGSFGYWVSATAGTLRSEVDSAMDSVGTASARCAMINAAQQTDIDEIRAKLEYLDTLARWMPRVEETVNEIHSLVRRSK